MRPPALVLLLLALPLPLAAQWRSLETGTNTEFRSAWAPADSVLWAGGRTGIILRTADAGTTWRADTIPAARDLFVIGLWAANADTAVALGTGFETSTARIYRTTDAGATWSEAHRDDRAGIFLDGLAFWEGGRGIAFGDPIDSTFVVLLSDDGGASWRQLPRGALPAPLDGEAGFAASGRAIVTSPGGHAWFGTGGGPHARVFHSADYGETWDAAVTPLSSGPSAGIFALAFRDSLNGIAVGGDHTLRIVASDNIARTEDGGRTWRLTGSSLPAGVRYGVAFVPDSDPPRVIAVGPSGAGYSTDDGATWEVIDREHWNTVVFSPNGVGWMLGVDGRVARRKPGH